MEEERQKEFAESVNALTKLVDGLRSRRYLEMLDNPKKFLFYNFISGLASGVGTAIGASIIFGLLIWLLSKLEIVPVFGNWIITLINYIQKARGF